MKPVERIAAAIAAAVALLLTVHLGAQSDIEEIPDPDPQLQLQALEVAEGFEINLFATEPMIEKPIQMNWDAEGRLWVATSSTYPQIKPGQKPNDKVIILEDTDSDGRADKSTVFADDLLIPTGLVPGDGGVYVANSTQLLHLKDTDGDGKADQRRVVLSGFGTEDVHHMIHTFRWGPGGQLYFNQSIYTHSHIETPWGVRRLRAGGIWQLRPPSLRLEVFARGSVNPWGHQFDRWGQSFGTDGAFAEGINYIFPGAAFNAAQGTKQILRGLNPGQPKHCGLEVLSGRHLPESFAGTLLTNDYRGNRVNRFILSEDGSGFASLQTDDLVWTNHVAFRPVDVRMGPDGAIYLADWYNPIIQHGEVDFRDPRRDHEHGRIWRITAKNRPLVKPPKLAGASTEALLDALKLPEDWTRDQARRVLIERGSGQVLPAAKRWVAALDRSDPDFEHYRLEALWLCQALDAPAEATGDGLLSGVLTSKDHRARAAAVRVLYEWQDRVEAIDDLLARAAADRHPRVRLEAVNALRRRGSAEAARTALGVLDAPMDVNLEFALALTLRELEPHWLSRVEADPGFFGPDPRKLIFALKSVDKPAAIKPLARLYHRGRVSPQHDGEVLALIAARGGPEELRAVFEMALSDQQSVARRASLLSGLEQAARQRSVRPGGDLTRVAQLLHVENDELRAPAARLAGHWKISAARERLLAMAADSRHPAQLRQASVEALALLGETEDQLALERLAAKGQPLDLRILAAAALASLDVQAAARRAVAVLAVMPPAGDPSALYSALFAREDGPEALAAALAGKTLPADIALAGLRTLSTSGRQSDVLEGALETAGGESLTAQSLSEEQKAELIRQVTERGDPARGERIYRRSSQACMDCHAIAGAGGRLGTDLTSIGSSAPLDYLIDSLLEPTKQIKEGFHLVTLKKKDASVLTGISVRQDDSEVVLRDGSDKEIVVPRDSVQQSSLNPISLMPATTGLRRDELVDLIRFLSELGKAGDYNPSKARLVRRWRVLEASEEAGEQIGRHGREYLALGGQDLPWKAAYSSVAGLLPAEELPEVKRGSSSATGLRFSFARFDIRVSTAGPLALGIHQPEGLLIWIGDQKVDQQISEQTVFDLPQGTHRVTVSIDREARPDHPLRVELIDVPGSPAQAQFVTGK